MAHPGEEKVYYVAYRKSTTSAVHWIPEVPMQATGSKTVTADVKNFTSAVTVCRKSLGVLFPKTAKYNLPYLIKHTLDAFVQSVRLFILFKLISIRKSIRDAQKYHLVFRKIRANHRNLKRGDPWQWLSAE